MLGYRGYLDVTNWMDFHLLETLSGQVDAIRLSTYFYKPRNGKLMYGPRWDYDRAWESKDDGRDDNPRVWDTVSCYIWQQNDGSLHILPESSVYPALKDCYVNCICLNWTREFLCEGDEYWKVFINQNHTIYHKLEFDGKKHLPALLLKPYRDIVYRNTRFMTTDYQRFKTLEDAEVYCYKVKNNINVHQ